jgi:hypothetical protein
VKKIKGQVLTEAMIAMGIITIGILGMTGFLSKAISEGRYIADQTTAVNLAAEGIEIAKNILDGNAFSGGPTEAWNRGFNTEGFYEVDYKSQSLGDSLGNTENQGALRTLKREQVEDAEFYSYSGTAETSFKRSVQITYVASHQIRATARVYWMARGGRLNNISLASDFYYWR